MPDMTEEQIKKLYAHLDAQLNNASNVLNSKMDTMLQSQLVLKLDLERLSGNPQTGTYGRIDRLEQAQLDMKELLKVHNEKFNEYDRIRWKLTGYAVGVGTASGVGAASVIKLLFG